LTGTGDEDRLHHSNHFWVLKKKLVEATGIEFYFNDFRYTFTRLTVERSRWLYPDDWRTCWSKVNSAIGPPTRDTLVGLGVDVHVVPDNATFPDLVKAVALYLSDRVSK